MSTDSKQTAQYDLIIRNAMIVDGSGTAPYHADLGVIADQIARIAAVGQLDGQLKADGTSIDAAGLALAPGFIDVHTHDDREVLDAPAMLPKLTQGVTTVIAGNCGISLSPWKADRATPAPLSLIGTQKDYRFARVQDYVAAVNAAEPAVNVGFLIGHSTLRVNAVADLGRGANAEEIAHIDKLC